MVKRYSSFTSAAQWWNHDRARYSEFAARYRAELDNNPAVERLLTLMHEHADSRITLVFGAKTL